MTLSLQMRIEEYEYEVLDDEKERLLTSFLVTSEKLCADNEKKTYLQ
jgi:hypothetical protein